MDKNSIKDLVKKNIIPASGAVFEVFKKIYKDALYYNYNTPSEYMATMWYRYKKIENSNNKNGKIFESLFATILYREKIYPIFVQAKVAFVPNINFDFVIFARVCGPIALSLKTSLRERYKQADLEAVALKYVHRKAKCFLLTLHKDEALNVNKKIRNGDLLGIDKVYLAISDDFEALIRDLKILDLYEPEPIEVIKSQKIIK